MENVVNTCISYYLTYSLTHQEAKYEMGRLGDPQLYLLQQNCPNRTIKTIVVAPKVAYLATL